MFFDLLSGDLHLGDSDVCAIDAGVDISDLTTVDFDGQLRSASSPDVGADTR